MRTALPEGRHLPLGAPASDLLEADSLEKAVDQGISMGSSSCARMRCEDPAGFVKPGDMMAVTKSPGRSIDQYDVAIRMGFD
jgi:hypothetical protein